MDVTIGAVGCAMVVQELGLDLDECGCAAAVLEPVGGFMINVDATGYILMATEVHTGRGRNGDLTD